MVIINYIELRESSIKTKTQGVDKSEDDLNITSIYTSYQVDIVEVL